MTTQQPFSAQLEQTTKDTSLWMNFVVLVTTILSTLGLHAMLPDDDWVHYLQVGILGLGVFASLKLLWTYQTKLFVPLACARLAPSTWYPAIISHIGAVILILCISTSTGYVAVVWERASEQDTAEALTSVIDDGLRAKRNFLGISAIKSFVDNAAIKMATLANDAKLGKLSGTAGEGSVYRTYHEASLALRRLSQQIERNHYLFENQVAELDLAQNKMRRALHSDLPLDEKITAFERAYRKQADHYTRIVELGLSRQIETVLNGFLDQSMPTNGNQGNLREALKLAEHQVRETVNEIHFYVQDRVVSLRPMPPYELASPAIVSFRYIREFWVQFALACALDLTLLIGIWLQIATKKMETHISEKKPINHTL